MSVKVPNSYFSRGASPSEDQLRSAVPAMFATAPADNVSDRYGFVSTERIVNIMREDGYNVTHARGGIRMSSRSHGLHEVRLRKGDTPILNEVFPEIVLINSHDGKSSALLHMGLYRKICDNGLIIGEAFQTSFRVPHIGDPRDNVLNAAMHLMDSAPRIGETIDTWRKRALTPAEVAEFGRRASELRKFSGRVITDPSRNGSVTAARRQEDAPSNLWTVFNRTQENLIRGGALVASANGKIRRARSLRAVKPLIELNRGLWDLAEEFLPA